MATQQRLPGQTDDIDNFLQAEYGFKPDLDIHIWYFYIRFEKEIRQSDDCQQQIIAILNKSLGQKLLKQNQDGMELFSLRVKHLILGMSVNTKNS